MYFVKSGTPPSSAYTRAHGVRGAFSVREVVSGSCDACPMPCVCVRYGSTRAGHADGARGRGIRRGCATRIGSPHRASDPQP
eukprot:4975210-Prymnesium_polylepis.1